jgi:hypothetical protein
MTDSTNPVETSMDMQPRSLPTRPYTSSRCYITNSCVGKSVHLFLGQTMYLYYMLLFITCASDFNFATLTSTMELNLKHFLCYAHCAHCYIQYINQHMHSVIYNKIQILTHNSWQVSNSYMFWHQSAILMASTTTKEYESDIALTATSVPGRAIST